MTKGDTFEMRWSDWYRIVTKTTDPIAIVDRSVVCEVLRVYSDGDRIFYVCRAIAGTEPYGACGEFVMEANSTVP